MPLTDYINWLHGKAAPTVGVDIGHSGSEYSEDELDTERVNPGWGKAGQEVGLHMLVNEAFNTLTSVDLTIAHAATTTPTVALVSRNITLASGNLAKGKHVFLPIPKGSTVLRYIRGLVTINGSNPTTGQVCMWIGPPDGSENA
jgi:hypothetical protein